VTSAIDFTPVTITLAGRIIPDAADEIIAYLEGRVKRTSQRIQDYDYGAFLRRQAFGDGSSPHRITEGTITSANKLKGRLAHSQLPDWYRPREEACNWDLVSTDQTFVTCDPSGCRGAYENVCAIWYNFQPLQVLGHKEFNVGGTQINKVLHQVLPDLIPIFDDKLFRLYFNGDFRDEAKRICRDVVEKRDVGRCSNEYNDGFLWEPLRRDMAEISMDNFKMIRDQVVTRPCNNDIMLAGARAQVWAARNLSDVRLIDMIAWQL